LFLAIDLWTCWTTSSRIGAVRTAGRGSDPEDSPCSEKIETVGRLAKTGRKVSRQARLGRRKARRAVDDAASLPRRSTTPGAAPEPPRLAGLGRGVQAGRTHAAILAESDLRGK
jgi:hypothetical protein